MTSPNIVLILMDDLGYGDLSCCSPEKLIELRAVFEDWKARTVAPDNHYRIPFPDQYARQRTDGQASGC